MTINMTIQQGEMALKELSRAIDECRDHQSPMMVRMPYLDVLDPVAEILAIVRYHPESKPE